MPDRILALVPVLGHTRVLQEAAVDPARRVTVHVGARLDGVAAWEPLFGRHGEGVIAVRDTAEIELVRRLFGELLERAADAGVALVRFALQPGQGALAATLAADLPDATLGDELRVVPRPR